MTANDVDMRKIVNSLKEIENDICKVFDQKAPVEP